jgi:myo-inositol-1(or 4)-monophosphatase
MSVQHPMVNVAVKAARRAARIIVQGSENLDALTIRHKSLNDLVSEVDRASEQAIIDVLRAAYPDHAILAEESGSAGDSEYVWIIDPLDGTTNFLHGFQQYCISIALVYRGVITHGVIFDPTRNDLYTATRGRGAYLNDKRLRVGKRDKLIDSLIGTGFPFRMFQHIDAYTAMLKDMMTKTAGVRRAGSAALDLANVAAGRLDAFWEIGLAPWDMAAGCLMIQEAGGLVGDLEGNETHLQSGNLAAGSPKIFAQLLQVLKPHLTPALHSHNLASA